MQPLQNSQSLDTYIRTWQEVLCYYCRVNAGERFSDDLFEGTDQQEKDLQKIYEEMANQETKSPDPDVEDWAENEVLRLDRLVLD